MQKFRTNSSGYLEVVAPTAAPLEIKIVEQTTPAGTRFPTSGAVEFSSGIAVLKATAGELNALDVYYTGNVSTNTLWIQLHDAASATAPTNSTFLKSWPLNKNAPRLEVEFLRNLVFSNGIKLAWSSTPYLYTADTGPTGAAVGYGV